MNTKRIIGISKSMLNRRSLPLHEYLKHLKLDIGSDEISDEKWAEAVYDCLSEKLSDLDEEIDGIIMAFVDYGLWNGRKQGFLILDNNIADIFHTRCDEAEWYGDGYNIRGRMIHHDGTNYALYRIAKDKDTAERIAYKICKGEIDEAAFRKRTRSLYPYVAEIYGWK